MTFSKSKWLKQANAEKKLGYLSQQDIQNAIDTWVDGLDGKEIDPSDERYGSLAKFCQ